MACAKVRANCVAMSMKQPAADKKPTIVVANDPEDLQGKLKRFAGSQSDNWNNLLANQAVSTLCPTNDRCGNAKPSILGDPRRTRRDRTQR
jgi:hypothetical protein